jgi:hypothetical protein
MKISGYLAFMVLVSVIMFCGACNDGNDTKKFSEINKALADNLKQLNKEPGIILTGTASDPTQKLFKVGIGFVRNKITNERLKQVIEIYLKDSASLTSEHDWKKLFLPYNLKIEEMENGKSDLFIAEKPIGKTELIWKE